MAQGTLAQPTNGAAQPPFAPLSAPTAAIVAANPNRLLEIAVSQNADIEKLLKLMDLQERWERNEARKAFFAAKNAFKANPPEIFKNKHVNQGINSEGKQRPEYDHATLDHVCDVIVAELGKHDLSHTWRFTQPAKDWLRVTCVLSHELGFSEEATLEGPPDASGGKNTIQAISSTVTYLERYTLLGVVGLAAKGTDNDGAGADPAATATAVATNRVDENIKKIAAATNRAQLRDAYKAAYVEASGAGDQRAMAEYIRIKDARLKVVLQ